MLTPTTNKLTSMKFVQRQSSLPSSCCCKQGHCKTEATSRQGPRMETNKHRIQKFAKPLERPRLAGALWPTENREQTPPLHTLRALRLRVDSFVRLTIPWIKP